MNVLLDTHTFIWLDSAPEKLSKTALELCQNKNNTLYLSTVSAWEMQIKNQLGKLNFEVSIPDIHNVQLQDIQLEHIYRLKDLPRYHNDPFDRLLLSQLIIAKSLRGMKY